MNKQGNPKPCACGCGRMTKGAVTVKGHHNRLPAAKIANSLRNKGDKHPSRAHYEQWVQHAEMMRSRIRRGYSKLEEKISPLLGSAFRMHHRFPNKMIADFFNPITGVVVEVNGCFHHACNVCGKAGFLYPLQARVKDCYERKLKMYKAKGYTLFEVWEHDFKEAGRVEEIVAVAKRPKV